MTVFSETTSSITISVLPEALESESRVEDSHYVFAYTITIVNHSDETLQLMERHWIIESAGELMTEVNGPGVVGVQPVFKPGGDFAYTSTAAIKDPIGSMRGTYTFQKSTGGVILVQIPEFRLVYPTLYH